MTQRQSFTKDVCINDESQQDTEYLPVKMKSIDLEQIYPQNQKDINKERIDVFFDRQRKLKRYADGTKLIKLFVQPFNSPLNLRRLSPTTNSERQKSQNLNSSRVSDTPLQDQVKNTSDLINKQQKRDEVNNKIGFQMTSYGILCGPTLLQDQQENQIMPFLFGDKNQTYKDHVIGNDQAQNQRYYEKNYTRMNEIKKRYKSNELRSFSFTRDYQKRQAFNHQIKPQKQDLRIIAPFVTTIIQPSKNVAHTEAYNKTKKMVMLQNNNQFISSNDKEYDGIKNALNRIGYLETNLSKYGVKQKFNIK